MIRRLALVQHVLFAVLVVVGAGRGIVTGAPVAPLTLAVGLLVGWYAVGVRGSRDLTEVPGEAGGAVTGGVGEERRGAFQLRGGVWLLGLVGVWLLTVVISPDMVWVAFSLWLLAGHLLPLTPALVLSGLVLLVVVARGGPAEDWSIAAVVGPSVGGVFAVALTRGLRVVIRDSLERERLVTELVRAQEETEVLHGELAQAQREAGVLAERARLSRDIHDTLAQGFSSILLLARAGSGTDDPAGRSRLLGQIETSAADGLEEARRVVGELAPAPLESGLGEALRRIVDRFADETGTFGQVRIEGDLTSLPPALEVGLLRVAQSALANVRQHAAAGRVVVTLAEAEDLVRLDVVDDGQGFDTSALTRPAREVERGGYGLRASRARLRELGGGLDVESEPGGGTAVSAWVPWRGISA